MAYAARPAAAAGSEIEFHLKKTPALRSANHLYVGVCDEDDTNKYKHLGETKRAKKKTKHHAIL